MYRNSQNLFMKGGLRPRRRARRAGFTMVELLLVLAILTTLAAIVVPKFTGRSQQAKVTAARTEISNLEVALDAFEVDNGYYPQGDDGILDLMEPPPDAMSWRGPYMKKLVDLDPWGNPYIYECPGEFNVDGYDLLSFGADGKLGGEGDDADIVNWEIR